MTTTASSSSSRAALPPAKRSRTASARGLAASVESGTTWTAWSRRRASSRGERRLPDREADCEPDDRARPLDRAGQLLLRNPGLFVPAQDVEHDLPAALRLRHAERLEVIRRQLLENVR